MQEKLARALISFMAVLCSFAPPVAAAPAASAALQATSDERVAAFFDDYITKTIERLELPGGAVVVVRDGRQILARGYGHADLASQRPVDIENSLFRAASISKTFTWLLVMQLVEEGRLDLDEDVNAYLDFRIPDAFDSPITVRHLLTHSAGFADRFFGVFEAPDPSKSLGQQLAENIPARVYAPGSTVAYSNYGAGLAGYIVERLRGQSFERVVAEWIFEPVGMRHATFAQPVPAALQPLLVSNYRHGSETPGEFRTTAMPPLGALTASAGDMGRFLAMLLNEGRGENGVVVAPATLKRMLTLDKPLGPELDAGLGLGFLMGQYRGVRYAGHAGNLTTLATDLEILPDHGLGWYYVFNGQGPNENARHVRADLLQAVIEQLVAPQAPPVRAQGPSSAEDVAGSYISTRRQRSGPLMMSPLMDTRDVYAQADGSLFIYASGRGTEWLPAGRDRFVEKETGIPLAVTRGLDGRVERIASELLFPAAEFERAPEFITWVEGVTRYSLVTLVLAILARPVAWAMSKRRGGTAVASKAARFTWPLARLSFWMIVATLLAWAVFALMVAMEMSFLFSAPPPLRIFLGVMSMLSLPFAAIMLADALVAWRDPARGWLRRSGALAVAIAALGIAWLFYVFDITNFSTNW